MSLADENLVEGPSLGAAAGGSFLRVGMVAVLPLAIAFAVYNSDMGYRGDREAILGLTCFGVFFALLIAGLVALQMRTMRRLRTQHLVARNQGAAGLAWSATLLAPLARYSGSVHVTGNTLSFIWHTPFNAGAPSETVIQAASEQVVAIELQPARSPWEWFVMGSPHVVVMLRDGRSLRLAAWSTEALANALREALAKKAGAPAGPPALLDDASPAEIGRMLSRRFPFAVFIVPGEKDPHVLLHGPAETLDGTLALARDVLRRERDALAPYEKAREPAREKAREGTP